MLAAGTRLGPYEVVAPLGAGGMGEVYRARDTRLGRDVAVKVVRGAVPATPEARQRFEREARTVSALNHPHICALYDIGREGEIDYLVLELIDGDSLAQRLAKGALPVRETLRLGIQVADALERAHRAGVVHRDLKPGNVMIARSGAKLMDFGLARIQAPRGLAAGSVSPTLDAGESAALTAKGSILGTIQYLAPEQLEGAEADPRSDLWALGCVLYEMATGRPAFAGRSQASLVGAIMGSEPPPISQRAPLCPPALEHLVRACLAKDPDERIQSAHDVRLQLEGIRDAGPSPHVPAPRSGWKRVREPLAWTLAAAGLLAAGAQVVLRPGAVERVGPARFSISPPSGQSLTDWSSALAASPDGSQLAFIASSSTGSVVWLRPLSWEFPKPLPQTQGANRQVIWSPDGRYIGFFAARNGRQCLLKAPVEGGNATVLCDVVAPRGGCWNRRGDILLAPSAQGPLFRTNEGGGTLRPVTTLDSTRGETSHRFPCFLPDGEHFLFAALPAGRDGYPIYIGSLRGGRAIRIMNAESAPVFAAPGALVFLRKGEVTVQRFDLRRLVLGGQPATIGAAPAPSDMDAEPVATASRAGSLFILRNARVAERLLWLDAHGAPRDTLELPYGYWRLLRISPDGRRACAYNGGYWTIDLARSTATRIGASSAEHDFSMVWSPDSRRVAYTSSASGRVEIYVADADGSGTPELLPTTNAQFKSVLDWSLDGKQVVFGTLESASEWDIWRLPLEGDRKPVPCVSGPEFDGNARLSPDSRWLAFTSEKSGERAVFVQAFPGGASRVRVSPNWGDNPRWDDSGRAITFRSWPGMLRAGFTPGEPPVLAAPRLAFAWPERCQVTEIAPGGRALASFTDAVARRDIKAVLNWPGLLER